MIQLKDIQIEKSITKKRLCYKRNWFEYFEVIIFNFSLIFGFILCPYLIYKDELNFKNVNDRLIGNYILPLIVFFAVYMVLRSFTQFRLKQIKTNHDDEYNLKSILTFAKSEQYMVRRKYNQCIILDQLKMDNKYAKTGVLILKNGDIYFTYVQDGFRLNTPTVISHLFFGWRLKKWIKKESLH